MPQIIVLNECSYPSGDTHISLAQDLLIGLVDVVISVRKILPQAVLICNEPLAGLRLGSSHSLVNLLNAAGAVREKARLLLAMGARAPFRVAADLFGDKETGVTVYKYAGQEVKGVGLAHMYDGLPVSFAGEGWGQSLLELDLEQLTEDTHEIRKVEIRHASTPMHVAEHKPWLKRLKVRDVQNAEDLHMRRAEIFPHLEFGKSLLADLRSLGVPAFQQVMVYLSRLDNALEEWDPTKQPAPSYPPHTTDEHESRKRLCNFPDAHGNRTLCSWHGRYTPGAGRIHFKLEASPKRAIVGYIGFKL